MQEGADPNLANGTGVAPIHEGMAMQINWRDLINVALAARLGSIGILQILLDASAYIDQQDGSGWTALHCAIKYEFRSSLTLSPPSSVPVFIYALQTRSPRGCKDFVRSRRKYVTKNIEKRTFVNTNFIQIGLSVHTRTHHFTPLHFALHSSASASLATYIISSMYLFSFFLSFL